MGDAWDQTWAAEITAYPFQMKIAEIFLVLAQIQILRQCWLEMVLKSIHNRRFQQTSYVATYINKVCCDGHGMDF